MRDRERGDRVRIHDTRLEAVLVAEVVRPDAEPVALRRLAGIRVVRVAELDVERFLVELDGGHRVGSAALREREPLRRGEQERLDVDREVFELDAHRRLVGTDEVLRRETLVGIEDRAARARSARTAACSGSSCASIEASAASAGTRPCWSSSCAASAAASSYAARASARSPLTRYTSPSLCSGSQTCLEPMRW